MSRLEHPLSAEELMAYGEGQLRDSHASKVVEHIQQCPECTAALADARLLSQQMASWQVEEAPEQITERVLSELRPPAPWWTIRRRVWAYAISGAVAFVLLLSVMMPSLLRSRQAAQETVGAPFLAPEAKLAQQEQPPVGVTSGPMVIRTIKLTLITKEFDAARSRIDAIVQQAQGYIDRLSLRADAGTARTLSATLRLPASRAESGLSELKKLGGLMEESQNSSDITSQYVDLSARLSNSRNSEQRLLGLLRDRAGNLKEVVEMEREIASVREGIERMEAQRKDLNNKVQFVTIQLELAEEYHAQLEPSAPSKVTQIRNAAVDGMRSAVENILAITLFMLLYGPTILIWLVVVGSLIFLLSRLRLRLS